MKIQTEFKLRIQDIIDAHNLAYHGYHARTLWLFIITLITIIGLAAVFIGMYILPEFFSFLFTGYSHHFSLTEFWKYVISNKDLINFSGIFLAVFLLLSILGDLLLRFRLWLTIRRNPDTILVNRRVSFRDKELEYSSPSAVSNIKWDYFSRAVEGQNSFVLIRSKDSFIVIPKRAFSSEIDEQEFREFVNSNMPLKTIIYQGMLDYLKPQE